MINASLRFPVSAHISKRLGQPLRKLSQGSTIFPFSLACLARNWINVERKLDSGQRKEESLTLIFHEFPWRIHGKKLINIETRNYCKLSLAISLFSSVSLFATKISFFCSVPFLNWGSFRCGRSALSRRIFFSPKFIIFHLFTICFYLFNLFTVSCLLIWAKLHKILKNSFFTKKKTCPLM